MCNTSPATFANSIRFVHFILINYLLKRKLKILTENLFYCAPEYVNFSYLTHQSKLVIVWVISIHIWERVADRTKQVVAFLLLKSRGYLKSECRNYNNWISLLQFLSASTCNVFIFVFKCHDCVKNVTKLPHVLSSLSKATAVKEKLTTSQKSAHNYVYHQH